MDSAKMKTLVRKRICRIEDRLRRTVDEARRRVRSMADTPDDGRRSIRLEINELAWLAGELARLSQEAERDYAARDALAGLLQTVENATAVEEQTNED